MGMHSLMLIICAGTSGGHFNPAITLSMLLASKDPKNNFPVALLMIAGQFAGALLSLLWVWLALCDYGYLNYMADHSSTPFTSGYDRDHSIPRGFVGSMNPTSTSSVVYDTADSSDPSFYYNWQTFYGTLMSSFILCLGFSMIKVNKKETDLGLKVILISLVLQGTAVLQVKFGSMGFNPFISIA
jgi:glycerol uptake facilitator-like aquaporin